MRNKRAKKIRRELQSQGLDLKQPAEYLQNKKTGQIILDPASPRGLYQRFKRRVL